jgi:large subunit ribosomal protein L21
VLDVDRLQVEVGSTVELKDVLLLSGAGDVRVGTPLVDGATVMAEVLEHGRDKKIRVFKYKNKTRYRRRFGHRQDFTRLAIRQILADGKAVETAEPVEKPKRPSRKKAAPKAEEPATEGLEGAVEAAEERPVEPVTAEATGEPAAEAASREAEGPKPRRARAARAKAKAEPEPATEETPEGE